MWGIGSFFFFSVKRGVLIHIALLESWKRHFKLISSYLCAIWLYLFADKEIKYWIDGEFWCMKWTCSNQINEMIIVVCLTWITRQINISNPTSLNFEVLCCCCFRINLQGLRACIYRCFIWSYVPTVWNPNQCTFHARDHCLHFLFSFFV